MRMESRVDAHRWVHEMRGCFRKQAAGFLRIAAAMVPESFRAFPVAAIVFSGILFSGIAQESETDTTLKPVDTTTRELLQTPEGEGSRYISEFTTSSLNFSEYRRKAVGGTAAFFTGVGIDLAVGAIIAGADVDTIGPGGAIMILTASGAVTALRMAGVPVACTQASKAYDEYTFSYKDPPRNRVWLFYGLGWICAGGALISNVSLALNEDPSTAVVRSVFGLGRDALWGIACIKSIVYVKRLRDKVEVHEGEPAFSLVPTVRGSDGVGLLARLRF